MNFDKALELLAQQLETRQLDKALQTFRVVVNDDSGEWQPCHGERLKAILQEHQGLLFAQFLEVSCMRQGFCMERDPVGAAQRLMALADQGEPNACIQLAMRHVSDPKGAFAPDKARDLARLAPLVREKIPYAKELDVLLDVQFGMDAVLSRSPQLAVHNAIRRHRAAMDRLLKIANRDALKQRNLKKTLA